LTTSISILAAKCCKKRIVFTAHFHPFNTLQRPVLGFIFFHLLIRPFMHFIDAIITLNNEDTMFFRKYKNKVFKIPHWIPYNVVKPNTIKKKNMILFVGRVNDSNKGFEHIIHLPLEKYEFHCVGIGEVSNPQIIRHINISREELYDLYAQSSLLVVPSKYEAFSLVSLEALSNNTPILISEGVRIADYLPNCAGVVTFKYGDFNDFINKVENTIGVLVDTKKIFDIFDRSNIKEKYKEIYLNLICSNV
jgi:glycosyltransferase involved in cell wall biosynthesis